MTHEIYEQSDPRHPENGTSAASFGAVMDIHPADHIFRIIRAGSASEEAALQEYFKGGAETARWLRDLIARFRPVDQPFTLLDFAAGYGRVARHIPAALPKVSLVASDVHAAAVPFLESIGVAAHQSSASPATFTMDRRFDVILALSFFTHMPKSSWTAWLRALLRHLEPGGHLIFTTHGVTGMKVMGDGNGTTFTWDEDGFWFAPISEQTDIDLAEYGSSGTSFRYVRSQVEACGATISCFQENGAGYQDVYVVRAAVAEDDRRDAIVRTGRRAQPRPALPRKVTGPDDCLFYHSMDVPGLGPVVGQWDLRGAERDCLGGVQLDGRSVLEVGPASGYLTFWMERQGARVTVLDLDETEHWDLVPFPGRDAAMDHVERGDMIRRLNNSWWYTRAAIGSQASCYNGTAYDVDEKMGDFDVVTINSVLLHLRDPLLAMERAAARARYQFVITDVSERQFAAGRPETAADPALHFIPRAALGGPRDGWWYLPSAMVAEYLKILGFASIEKREFKARFQDGHYWDLYTVVGTRAA